jgi:hypothetical protein
MKGYWLAGVTALALTTSAAFAQNMSNDGPAGTYDMQRTQHSIDSNGVETDSRQNIDKSRTLSDGGGQLRAASRVRTNSAVTTRAPSVSTETTQSITTQ